MERSSQRVGIGLIAAAVIAVGVGGYTVGAGGPNDPDNPATATAAAAPAPAPVPALLLPNLRSLEPSDLRIETEPGGGRLLRFAGSLANIGLGPLLLKPRDGSGCPDGQRAADQLLHVDADRNGIFDRATDPVTERRSTACMLDHPKHDHWHFDAMAGYTLRAPGAVTPIVSRDKVSFCLRDNEQVPGVPVVVKKKHFGKCSFEGVQGISPGWVDVYRANLDGQTLELPEDLPAGPLCLEVDADPLGLLVETDESDNATAIAIAIDGDSVRRLDSPVCG